ncbi:MAG TPA: hypothetical protein VFU72_15590 [Nitrolancea sp.]|nr:hypothetical protein [Nitrolancea sp.]
MSEQQHQQQHESGNKYLIDRAENLTKEDKAYLEQYADKLSRTTLTARWINKVGEQEDHPGQTLATRNHDVIKHWAEERDGTPATVPGTQHDGRPGVLRFNFPGYGGKDLKEVSWQDWFKTFDDRKLTFLFQQKLKNGHQSNFFMVDSPFREHD